MTTVMAFGSVTEAQLYRMVELMNTEKIVDRKQKKVDGKRRWFVFFSAVLRKFQCPVLTIRTR